MVKLNKTNWNILIITIIVLTCRCYCLFLSNSWNYKKWLRSYHFNVDHFLNFSILILFRSSFHLIHLKCFKNNKFTNIFDVNHHLNCIVAIIHKQDPQSHRIIEKRRRDRMNNCLADLSKLIPTSYFKKVRLFFKRINN